jgi:CDP-diacylglycerol---glycerol-3-phosphate 3-phosphatidyltransferase
LAGLPQKELMKTKDIEAQLLSENFWNLPNFLSVLRILFLPFFVYYAKAFKTEGYEIGYYKICILLLSAIYLTDFLDGYLARLLKQETIYGKYLDPVCDKFVLIVSFTLLHRYFSFPVWMLGFLVIREILGAYIGYFVFYKKGYQGNPNWYGKIGVVLGGLISFYYLSLPFLHIQNTQVVEIPVYVYLGVNLMGAWKYARDLKDKAAARRGT